MGICDVIWNAALIRVTQEKSQSPNNLHDCYLWWNTKPILLICSQLEPHQPCSTSEKRFELTAIVWWKGWTKTGHSLNGAHMYFNLTAQNIALPCVRNPLPGTIISRFIEACLLCMEYMMENVRSLSFSTKCAEIQSKRLVHHFVPIHPDPVCSQFKVEGWVRSSSAQTGKSLLSTREAAWAQICLRPSNKGDYCNSARIPSPLSL